MIRIRPDPDPKHCLRESRQRNNKYGLYLFKVEMFVVTPGDASSSQTALQEVHSIERDMFDQLGEPMI